MSTGTSVARYPTLPMPQKGGTLPDKVVWSIGGGLIPFIPSDPALPASTPVLVKGKPTQAWMAKGLTPRADCMARLVARGVAISDAYRASYGHTGNPRVISVRANGISRTGRFASAVHGYRARLEEEAKQAVYGVQDFVMSRLVLESQTADSAAARIRATELLGKTEAMFTDVKRTERTLSKADAKSLKAQLEQRLMAALSRVSPALRASLSHDTGTGLSPMDAGNPGGQTVPGHMQPLTEKGTPEIGRYYSLDTPSQIPVLESTPGTDLKETPGGYSDEFSGPLILHGGLRGE